MNLHSPTICRCGGILDVTTERRVVSGVTRLQEVQLCRNCRRKVVDGAVVEPGKTTRPVVGNGRPTFPAIKRINMPAPLKKP